MQIKDDMTLTWPGKLKGDPSKRSREKYFHFHQDHGHNTSKCYDLKQQIEALIRQGKLQQFVSKERADPPPEQATRRDNEHPMPPLKDIRMIVGGSTTTGSSRKVRKTYLRMVQSIQLTGFIPKMARVDHPYDDALVVSIRVGDYNTHRVLVDNGSSANILYYSVF